MNFGFVLLGSAAAGAVGGLGAATRVHGRIWGFRFHDAELLEQGQALPPMAEPPANRRKKRSIVFNYVFSILGAGIVVWLIAFILMLTVANLGESASGESVTILEKVIPSLIFAAMFGAFGLLFPGTLLAVILHFVENKARLNAAEAKLTRHYWEEREQLRVGLEAGHVSVSEAIDLLLGGTPPALE